VENSAAFTQTSTAGAAYICPRGSRSGLISVRLKSPACNHHDPQDFRRIALSFEGAEESSRMGQPDFPVGGKLFATLASENQGYGNLKLSPEQQAEFQEELPQVFIPIPAGWGKNGHDPHTAERRHGRRANWCIANCLEITGRSERKERKAQEIKSAADRRTLILIQTQSYTPFR
jgi:hypothetical protein